MTQQAQQLQDALTIIESDPIVKPIAEFIRKSDTGFADFTMDRTSIAVYNPQTNRIWINTRYPIDTEELAATLVHEGTHAMDKASGLDTGGSDSIPTEIHSYTVQSEYWARRFPKGRHVTNDENEQTANEDVDWLRNGTLKDKITEAYSPTNQFLRSIGI